MELLTYLFEVKHLCIYTARGKAELRRRGWEDNNRSSFDFIHKMALQALPALM